MILKYHPEASNELDEAFRWYEIEQTGLGKKFVQEVEFSIIRIRNFPRANPHIIKDIRRALLPMFPYGVMYSAGNDIIEIYAIAHLHRKPFYWKKRR
jgi:hypothetical protein